MHIGQGKESCHLIYLPNNSLSRFSLSKPCGQIATECNMCVHSGKNKWNSVHHQSVYTCSTSIQFKTAYNHLMKPANMDQRFLAILEYIQLPNSNELKEALLLGIGITQQASYCNCSA